MGNIFNWFRYLETLVMNRRDDKYAAHRFEPNHPERLSPDQLITTKASGQKSTSLSSPITTTEIVTSSNKCSNFYLACRNNKIEEVKKLLKTIKPNEIDKIKPNGSTALHAACYHGHHQIVKLLLEAGADRAIPNKYKCLPFDEAKNEEIKKLFFRVPNSNRLVSDTGAIEWNLIDNDVLENAAEERHIIKSSYDNVTGTTAINKMFEKIENNYINQATETEDPKCIIKAYTAETDFYKILNQEIAGGAARYQNERRYIIALLSYHPKLDELSYIGTSYRIMEMNDDDLEKYRINCSLMTKSFLSSSIDRNIATWFLCRQRLAREQNGQMERCNINGKVIKRWVMCIYHIKHSRTALHIENSSQYANEGEILIMPYSVFQVKRIEPVKASYLSDTLFITEIELNEYDQYLNV